MEAVTDARRPGTRRTTRRGWWPRAALVLAAVALAAPDAAGQSLTGRIVGTVRDTSGGVIAGAEVVLEQPSTGLVRRTETSSTGDYTFTFVQPGEYVVQAESAGFQALRRPVRVAVQSTIRADFDLPLAGLVEEVSVAAPPPALRTDSAEIGEVIGAARIADLPLNGRRFADLVLLSAGTDVSTPGSSDTPLLQTGPNLNINGLRPTHNSYTIDGVTATDYYFSHLSASTSVDAISEFKILSGQYGAEFGGKGGGHVNVVTRSGSNRFHGTAFEFLRNDAFDSRNFFAPRDQPVPPFKQNQFGLSVGGPVRRNRLFFFANYEGLRVRETITKLATVPTAEMRAGNFAGLAPIYDPNTTTPAGARTPFPGNQIPADRVNNAARVLLELVPLPNQPGIRNNYLGQARRTRNDDQVNVRLDYAFANGDTVFARLSTNEIDALEPFGARGTNSLPGFASNVTTSSRNAALSYTRSFSSRHVMNVLAGYNLVRGGIDTTNQALDVASRAGLLVLRDAPASLRGVPAVNPNFTSSFGDDLSTLLRTNSTYQLSAQFYYTAGSHALTYGGEVMRHQFNPFTAIFARGSYNFTGRHTASTSTGTNGNGFADFLLGLPFSGTALAGNAIENARSTWYAVYLQDNWRVGPRLTVNLGLRYDLMPPFYDKNNRLAAIDTQGGRVIVSSSNGQIGAGADAARFGAGYPLPFVTSEEAGWPRALVDTDKTNIGPRLGFAYSPRTDLVVQGGYSIVYSVPPLNLQARMDRNPPFSGLLSPAQPPIPVFTTETAFASGIAPPSFGFLARDFKNARVQQWSAGVEKVLAGGMTVSATYVGSKTDHLDWFGSGNPARPCTPPCAALESRRVFPGLGNFTVSRNDARARYDGLQARAEQRPWHGLTYVASLTVAKSRDNSSSSSGDDNSVANDPFNLNADWGPSSYDRRVAFVLSYGYQLPFGVGRRWLSRPGPLNAVLGNWQVGGVLTAKTGDHFSVSIASCPANIGTGCRANVSGDPNLPAGDRSHTRWFNTGAFSAPAQGQFGDQARNTLVGPGYAVWDFSIHKEFPFAGTQRLQFRIEVFNVTNRANFDKPDSRFGAASFGAISSAKAARQVQFGLKYLF